MIDHADTADQLDHLHALAVAFDLRLARAGLSSWHHDSPRRLSLALLEVLGELRGSLDLLAVGAGLGGSESPYIARGLVPNATTRAAARKAIEHTWPYSTEEAPNVGQVHRRGSRVLPEGEATTRDGDCPASLHNNAAMRGSAAAFAALSARVADADPDPIAEQAAGSELLSALLTL